MKRLSVDTVQLSDDALKEASIHRNFSERSELSQEIISRKPDFYEKWALLVFLMIILFLTVCTWFIEYPDIVQANAVLIGRNAPKEIMARQTGKLTALFVKNNQRVTQGEILGWVESNANASEVIDLAGKLDRSKKIQNDPQAIAGIFDSRFFDLGELQISYQTFIHSLLQYNDYLVNGFYFRKKRMLLKDIVALRSMQEIAATQRKLTVEDNALAQKTYEMNRKLFEQRVISAEEYRQAQSVLLNKELSIPQADANIISQQNQVRDKQKEIDQLTHDILQQQLTFEQALQTLKSNVDEWLKQYTLQAPADGVIVFTLPLQQNQFIEQGKLLGYINPLDSEYYAEIRLPQSNFGKVDTGMKVQLRFNAYPYQEAGFVPGTLNYISAIAVDSVFLGTVQLDKGLESNQGKVLQYKNGLKAQALIITKDMRLLERLYYNIMKTTTVNK